MTRDHRIVLDGNTPEEVHIYRDEAGKPVGAVARFAPGTLEEAKTFRQFRHMADGWVMGLNGITLPLYRLPEIKTGLANHATVFVVEGELCVEAAVAIGLLATTNSGGAGKWQEHHSTVLAGADVVVLPDHDAPGHKHGQLVAASLHTVAKRVRVVELPGLPDKGDIVDWIRAGGAREQLLELVSAAADWQPTVSADDWPSPDQFSVQSQAAPFPVETGLPLSLVPFVEAAAKAVKIDETFPATIVPVTVSAAAGNVFSVRVSEAHVEPNLSRYACIFADPGERKSALFRAVTKPLGVWQESKKAEYQRQLVEFRNDSNFWAARARAADNKGAKAKTEQDVEEQRMIALAARAKIPSAPRRPLISIGDTTAQMLVRLMDECGGGFAVMSADGRHIVEAMLGQYRKDKSTDDSVFLRAHGGDQIDRARIGADGQGELRVVERPSLGLGLCLQPDKLRALATDARIFESGMLQRINSSLPRSLVGTRHETGEEVELDPREADRWSRIIISIAHARWNLLPSAGQELKVIELRLDPEATILRRAFANELEERQAPGGDLVYARGFASKAAGEAARLSALFHLVEMANGLGLRDEILIPAPTWRIAETHQRWQLAETLRSFAIVQEKAEHTAARRVLEWIARHPDKTPLSPRDLVSARIFRTVEEANPILTLLADMKWLRKGKESRQGGPRWDVHPLVFRRGPA